MRPFILTLLGILIAIEIIRRLGNFAFCVVELRYDPLYVTTNPDAPIAEECSRRHLLFPFGF